MLALTPRLQAVADFVQKGSVIADIGTDHAYIPAYLLQQGLIEKAFACDIREGPLRNAQQTIAHCQLSGVTFLLSDGLTALEGETFDTVIIAGMGGEMIAHILLQSPWCRQQVQHFILQPMTKAETLRSFLCTEGFAIEKESFAAEKDKLYSILSVRYTGQKRLLSAAQALLGFAVEHPLFEQKRQKEIQRLQKVHASLANKEEALSERREVLKLIKEIQDYRC
ncbi:MAG: SAM-dependent methyltransferase [Clostridia bacterium]|nr:SAM-dependent methyltransferase [Clostridia bacterium]